MTSIDSPSRPRSRTTRLERHHHQFSLHSAEAALAVSLALLPSSVFHDPTASLHGEPAPSRTRRPQSSGSAMFAEAHTSSAAISPLPIAARSSGATPSDRAVGRGRRRRAPRRRGEVVGQSEAAHHEQPVPGGLPQVVGDLGRRADQVADGAEQPVSQVVVADRIAGEPGIGGRERVAGGHRHQQHQIHRLLGVIGGGIVGSHQTPTEERHHLQQLDGDDQAPATSHPLRDLRCDAARARDRAASAATAASTKTASATPPMVLRSRPSA